MLEMLSFLHRGATRAVVVKRARVSDLAPDMYVKRFVIRVESMPVDEEVVAVGSMDPPRGMTVMTLG